MSLDNWFSPKKDVGAADVVAAVGLAGTMGAVLYNVGFFWSTGANLVSLLSFQDLLLGATAALYVGVLSVGLAGILSTVPYKGRLPRILAYGTVLAFILVLLVAFHLTGHELRYTITYSILAVGFAAVSARFFRNSPSLPAAMVFLGIVSGSTVSIGIGASEDAIASEEAVSVLFKHGSTILGTLFRVTSSYLFLFDDQSQLTIVSLGDVRKVQVGAVGQMPVAISPDAGN